MIGLRGICNFCGKTAGEIVLIEGPHGISICSECIQICNSILSAKDEEKKFKLRTEPNPPPSEIKKYLDEYVIGQEEAKKILSVAVYNHYKRISSEEEIEKSNILMVGPTGCGKTLLAKTLARFLKVPFAIANATSLTEAGYVGEDVENIILRLLKASDGDVDACQRGIIYIDEIDKIGKREMGRSITRDVSGEGVQQGLLQIIEGAIIDVPPKGGRKHPDSKVIPIDTTNILFICGGSFKELEEVIEDRCSTEKKIGFGEASPAATQNKAKPEDFIEFGLIPEFLGRLPILATLEGLTVEDLIKILTEPKNSIVGQYKKLFNMDGVELEFTEEAIRALAQKGFDRGTGARGLRAMIEDSMLQTMYDIPTLKPSKCTITEAVIEGAEPELVYAEG